ncbi:hypothetical protein [Gloeobacter kilaueensis]|uniref:Uncharacterized protein n=1 Tax=Gloeobacter kilaueensis (strain ATCC BAA-2537 / CCAP 1431/1 / ULC 316 / JS1) TaxID=1183438 RepID=U5QKI2_GLOK1|nr:hypothetical protein [Gloeobacter kilaueensis]AGY59421.1 hypothetical protein GKIL_3175 [Gloeobacter kilaueensis JS1]
MDEELPLPDEQDNFGGEGEGEYEADLQSNLEQDCEDEGGEYNDDGQNEQAALQNFDDGQNGGFADDFGDGQYQALADDGYGNGQYQSPDDGYDEGQYLADADEYSDGQYQSADDSYDDGQYQAAGDGYDDIQGEQDFSNFDAESFDNSYNEQTGSFGNFFDSERNDDTNGTGYGFGSSDGSFNSYDYDGDASGYGNGAYEMGNDSYGMPPEGSGFIGSGAESYGMTSQVDGMGGTDPTLLADNPGGAPANPNNGGAPSTRATDLGPPITSPTQPQDQRNTNTTGGVSYGKNSQGRIDATAIFENCNQYSGGATSFGGSVTAGSDGSWRFEAHGGVTTGDPNKQGDCPKPPNLPNP